jgi:hypothetical protein
MIDDDGRASPCSEGDPALAELAEQITRRLQAGDPVGADNFIDRYPALAGSIRVLLPTLHDLAELCRSLALERHSHRSGEDTDPRQRSDLC